MEKKIKPGSAVQSTSSQNSALVAKGSIREYARNNKMAFGAEVQESKASGYPTAYFKDKEGNVTGIVLSKRAGERFPIGAKLDADNLFVNERADETTGETSLIVTTGGNVTWVNVD